MGRITERAAKFAKKFHTPEPEPVSQAEVEATFARDFMSPAGLREQWAKIREQMKGSEYRARE